MFLTEHDRFCKKNLFQEKKQKKTKKKTIKKKKKKKQASRSFCRTSKNLFMSPFNSWIFF